MSIALYRKYRPGTFAEVRGQQHVTEPLQQALRNGRVHHAYLFSGPRGCGKTSGARILARSLNCVRGPTPEPCGECDSCVALAPGGPGSMDVIEIDAASHGGVDDARDLRERAVFAPAASRYKVYVIDEAHMVTREGFNALLKLVEEPPPHLKFVFATTEPDKVISTIRSRTHHYPFRLLPPALLRELLADICRQEGIEVEQPVLPLVVRAGAGSARDSLSVLEQILAGAQQGRVTYEQCVALLGYTDAALLDEVVEAFAAGDGAAIFDVVGRVVDAGHEPRRFATDLLERFRDLIILRSVPDAATKGLLEAPPDQMERMVAQAGRMGAAELSRAADVFHEGLTEMRGATSPRLLLELICARMLLPGAGDDESALLARLDRLERRMAIGGPPPESPQQSSSAAEPSVRSAPAPGAGTDRSGEAVTESRSAADAPSPAPASGAMTQSAPEGAPDPGIAAGDTPPAAEAETASSAPAAPEGPAAGALDVAAVRRAWPDVLEDVKHRRRVAWMILIGDVGVADVDERSLTLSFAKEGDRKGFSSSGSDCVLQQALQAVLGLRPEIRTITGSSGGQSGDIPRDPAPAGFGGETQPPASPAPGASESVPEPGEPGESSGAPAPEDGPASAPPDGGGSPSGAPGPSGDASAGGDPRERDGDSRPPREAPRTEAPRTEVSRPGTGAQSGGTSLSGMALIERELGAQVIEEFDES